MYIPCIIMYYYIYIIIVLGYINSSFRILEWLFFLFRLVHHLVSLQTRERERERENELFDILSDHTISPERKRTEQLQRRNARYHGCHRNQVFYILCCVHETQLVMPE